MILLVASVALAALSFPGRMLCIFLCLYVALEVLGVAGIVGYSMVDYLSLVIAAFVAHRARQTHSATEELPGISWLQCLAVLVLLQFFRSASMRDSLPTLCDALAFTLVFWSFWRISKTNTTRAATAFITGTCAAGLALLLASPLPVYRLGSDLGFNPNELGHVAGAALLLLLSGCVVRRQEVTFWCSAAVLALLLVLSESRSAIYACFGSSVLFLFLRRKRLTAACLVLAAVAFLALAYLKQSDADPFSLAGRLLSPVSESFEESGAQRATIWGFLLNEVGRYWKWGAGLRNVPEITAAAGIVVTQATSNFSVGYQSHNLYLTVLLELGIAGLLLLLGWQVKIVFWGLRRPFDNALFTSMMFYLVIQEFFEGFNLNFLSAFLLIVAYKAQSGSRPQLVTRT